MRRGWYVVSILALAIVLIAHVALQAQSTAGTQGSQAQGTAGQDSAVYGPGPFCPRMAGYGRMGGPRASGMWGAGWQQQRDEFAKQLNLTKDQKAKLDSMFATQGPGRGWFGRGMGPGARGMWQNSPQ
jgi:Spy/CpxP family protein refolding chaperone